MNGVFAFTVLLEGGAVCHDLARRVAILELQLPIHMTGKYTGFCITLIVPWLLQVSGLKAKLESIDRVDSGDYRYDQYGFRVPAVVVSPYARKDWVASEQLGDQPFDHASVLKLVEMMWGLPSLTRRDEAAQAPLACLDLTASEPPFLTPPQLPQPVKQWERDPAQRKRAARQRRRHARAVQQGRRGTTRAGVPW